MKTKVRITPNVKGPQDNYSHFYIDLLKARYENSDYLEIYGTISFQKGGIENFDQWYGMSLECRSDNAQDFLLCAKVMQTIHAYRDSSSPQPKEVLNIIGAQEHVSYQGRFLPITYNGYKVFNVLTEEKKIYTRIFAPTEALADKIRVKRKFDGYTLQFDSMVTF